MIGHDAALRLAATGLDFGLSPAERAELDAHLATCASCAADVRAMRSDLGALSTVPVAPIDPRRADALLAAALAPERSGIAPLRLALVAALVALLALGSLLVGAALLEHQRDDLSVVPPAPSPSVARPSATAPATVEASPGLPAVPAIDPAFTPAVAEGTRGAFALRLGGTLSDTEVSGGATCYWNWGTGEPVAEGIAVEGIALLGEDVSIYSYGGLAVHRRSGGGERVRYEPASGIRQWQADDLTVVAFDDLQIVGSSVPENGPASSAFFEPLGGRADTSHLSGVLAWRCEAPVAPPPSPYAPPSPGCPAPSVTPERPVVEVSLETGAKVTAIGGSYDIATCSTVENVDRGLLEPDRPLVAKPSDRPRVTVLGGWRLLRWTGSYRPAGSEKATSWTPVDLPSRPRTVEMPAVTTPGDWVVDLALVMTTDDGRAVGTFSFSILLRVSP